MRGDWHTHNDRQPSFKYSESMTYSNQTVETSELTDEEWIELMALKAAVSENPAAVHPDKMEKFTELWVRSDTTPYGLSKKTSYKKSVQWRTGSPLRE